MVLNFFTSSVLLLCLIFDVCYREKGQYEALLMVSGGGRGATKRDRTMRTEAEGYLVRFL